MKHNPRSLFIFKAAVMAAFVVAFGLIQTFSGCSTPPSARVVQVQSLKAVGQAAESAVTLTANLYAAHQITPAQARQVMDFYDQKFQPAFRVAVAAVNANMDSFASPDLQALANQLSNLVATFANKSTP